MLEYLNKIGGGMDDEVAYVLLRGRVDRTSDGS